MKVFHKGETYSNKVIAVTPETNYKKYIVFVYLTVILMILIINFSILMINRSLMNINRIEIDAIRAEQLKRTSRVYSVEKKQENDLKPEVELDYGND